MRNSRNRYHSDRPRRDRHRSQRQRHFRDNSRNRPAQRDETEQKFLASVAVDPSPRICLEKGSQELTMRAMDLMCPIGRGQRGLIVAPPGSGKTTFLKHLCEAISKSDPDIQVYCLLIDERPEEVTDFRRSVSVEVRWSSSDEDYEHHVKTANDLMKEAYRKVLDGEHVAILIDSLTRLSRVHNAERRSSGRTMSGGVDVRALEVPRRIFGSARNVEEGGSLTILATILIETGSRMDEVIFEEFKGTGNMEIVLSREISNRRIFPAMSIDESRTRREELLLGEEEYQQIIKIRNGLSDLNPVDATKTFVEQLQKFPSNKELLSAFSL